jgi:hypothetical protein
MSSHNFYVHNLNLFNICYVVVTVVKASRWRTGSGMTALEIDVCHLSLCFTASGHLLNFLINKLTLDLVYISRTTLHLVTIEFSFQVRRLLSHKCIWPLQPSILSTCEDLYRSSLTVVFSLSLSLYGSAALCTLAAYSVS